jgi:hypothetical protein
MERDKVVEEEGAKASKTVKTLGRDGIGFKTKEN